MPRSKLAAATYANNDLRDLIDGRRRYLRLTVPELLKRTRLTSFQYYKIIHDPEKAQIDDLRKLHAALRFTDDERQTVYRCIFP